MTAVTAPGGTGDSNIWNAIGHCDGWQCMPETLQCPKLMQAVPSFVHQLAATAAAAAALQTLLPQVVAELAHCQGLTLPPEISRASVSGLLLLLQALKLKGLLTAQQEELLRVLACQHDTRLLLASETVSESCPCVTG